MNTIVLQLSDAVADISMLQCSALFRILIINAHFVVDNATYALVSSATSKPTFSVEEEVVVIRNGWTPKKKTKRYQSYPNGRCLIAAGSPITKKQRPQQEETIDCMWMDSLRKVRQPQSEKKSTRSQETMWRQNTEPKPHGKSEKLIYHHRSKGKTWEMLKTLSKSTVNVARLYLHLLVW